MAFGLYRHTFQTIGDETGYAKAVSYIMGHKDRSMANVYRERHPREQLETVAAYVHRWLFEVACSKCGEPRHVWKACPGCNEGPRELIASCDEYVYRGRQRRNRTEAEKQTRCGKPRHVWHACPHCKGQPAALPLWD